MLKKVTRAAAKKKAAVVPRGTVKKAELKKASHLGILLHRGEKKMADDKAAATTATMGPKAGAVGTGTGQATAAETAPAPDPRLVSLVVALVPANGEVQPTEDQKALAKQLQDLVEGAQKKAQDKAKAGSGDDKGAQDEAVARFFSGDVAGAAAKKIADEQAKKDAEQQKAAQAAAGQAQPVAAGAK